ncbi:MAG: GxxExxY protein [Candidatus Latescibacter sp.]|nr:GxxExxY protein [Candidatus Latescibacter sp.]
MNSNSIKPEYKHSDITSRIIGCAMEVHTILGNGFQEVIYQRCLALEMQGQGLEFIREQEIPLFYKGINVGTRRVDFLVQDTIMVEIKALTQLEDVHISQCLNYLEAYNLDIGLLLNFGSRKLEFRRLTRH